MSETSPRGSDARPKCNLRSWSADSYVWRGKKRSRSSRNVSAPGGSEAVACSEDVRSTSCPRRWRRERKSSCGALGDALTSADIDAVCRKALTRRSLRQKFQDAVGQCFPLRSHLHPHPHPQLLPPGSSRSAFSVLFWSKRRIHVSELLHDDSPFSSKAELARCWRLLEDHGGALKDVAPPPSAAVSSSSSTSPPLTPLSWDDVCCSPGPGTSDLEDWDPSRPDGGGGHTDYILVPDLLQITNSACYWGVLDRFEAEALLEGQPEGTFLLRDSAQDRFLYSVSFRRYSRSLHARIEQNGRRFGFDVRDPCMYRDASVTGLLRHYSDPASCLFFEPLLSRPLKRNFAFSLQHLSRVAVCSATDYRGLDALPLPPRVKQYLQLYHIPADGGARE